MNRMDAWLQNFSRHALTLPGSLTIWLMFYLKKSKGSEYSYKYAISTNMSQNVIGLKT